MVSSSIDHMVAVTIFIAATLIFIGLFNQTIQTAIVYQNHRAIATKSSDLLDTMLLSPGIPENWGQTNAAVTGFGLQDPEFTQYKISPYSLMRLQSSIGTPIYYNATEMYYSNITLGGRNFLLVPHSLALNYSTATKLLGIRETYGFQLSLTPIVNVTVEDVSSSSSLTLRVKADGLGFPLSQAMISYCLLKVESHGQSSPYYDVSFGSITANNTGSVDITFTGVASGDSFAFIAYARKSGLLGVGYYERALDEEQYVVPFVDSFEDGQILLAHSYNVHVDEHPESTVFYNATYVLMAEDYTLREMPISLGKEKLVYGHGSNQTYDAITIPTFNPGILVLTYNTNNGTGVVMMPWGISTMSFPVVFGGDPQGKEWVSTDIRQVTVGEVAYQAKLAVWSLQGYQVNG